jgi:hypothetical protein
LVGKGGECDVGSQHLQGCSPRLCRLRTDGFASRELVLNVLITCCCYGPSKYSSLPSTEGWLYPHCFNDCLGRETGYGPMDRLAVMLWIELGPFFSGAVALSNVGYDFVKG